MRLERDDARFFYKGMRMIEVFAAGRKEWLPVNVKVIPIWLNCCGPLHKRKRRIVNVPRFRNWNPLRGTANIGHAKSPAYGDLHWHFTCSMLANMPCVTQRECTKLNVVAFEQFCEFSASAPFRSRKTINPRLHYISAVHAKTTLIYQAPS